MDQKSTIARKVSKRNISGTRPQYQQVRDALKEEIAKLSAGDNLASDRQLSELFEVDRQTIRTAMHDLAREGFVLRRHGRATVVLENSAAPSDRQHASSKLIGVSIPDVEIQMNARLLKGIDEEAAAQGYGILVRNSCLDNRRERTILEELRQQPLAGIIVNPFSQDIFDADYHRLLKEIHRGGTRIVLLEQTIDGLEELPAVHTDKVQLGYRAAEHLIMLGHRRICYLTTGHFDAVGQACLKGHLQALNDHGIEPDPSLIVEIPVEDSSEPARDAIVRRLREDSNAFSAITTHSFSMTYGIMKALKELSLRAPEDVAVVGSDVFENPQMAQLTHTLQPFHEMGRSAVRMMLGLDGTGGTSVRQQILLQPRLIVGSSCGMRQPTRNAALATGNTV